MCLCASEKTMLIRSLQNRESGYLQLGAAGSSKGLLSHQKRCFTPWRAGPQSQPLGGRGRRAAVS